MRRNDAISLTAIYHIAMGVPFVLGAVALLFLMIPALFAVPATGTGVSLWPAFLIGIGLFFTVLFAVAFILVGIGLWLLWPWARWGAIVLSILMLPAFPVWTIIGALTIWYLLQPEARRAFGAL